jgi:hypothetical protein
MARVLFRLGMFGGAVAETRLVGVDVIGRPLNQVTFSPARQREERTNRRAKFTCLRK